MFDFKMGYCGLYDNLELSNVVVNAEEFIILLVYNSETEAEEAFGCMYELFGENDLSVKFEFIMQSYIYDRNKLIDPESLVTITIHETEGSEFLLIKSVPVKYVNSTLMKILGVSVNLKSQLEIDSTYRLTTLGTAFKHNDGISVPYSGRLNRIGFTNISKITVLPYPENMVIAPALPTMIGPKE
jgi:hypothetical protein